MAKSTKAELARKFAALLKATGSEDKQAKQIQIRLVKLGLSECCDRCGGSGHYSFNLRDGTRCFKCGGSGVVPQKLTDKLYSQAKELVNAGELDRYLERLRLATIGKRAMDEFFRLWDPMSKLYKWGRACGPNPDPIDTQIADLNSHIYNMYKKLEAIHNKTFGKNVTDEVKMEVYTEMAAYLEECRPKIAAIIDQARRIRLNAASGG